MRGFKPKRASGANNYADGGVVSGIKRALGFDPERAARIAEYKAQQKDEAEAAAAAATAAAPAATPKPDGGALQNAANALRNRRKQIDEAAGYKNGGMVRGPGTGTSDDIETEIPAGSYIMPADTTRKVGAEALGELGKPVPVALSNGEYQMPPEQVHAVGVQALNQIKDATHTPVAMAAARGFPVSDDGARLFFADGGLVQDDERHRRGSSFGDAAAATADPRTRVVGTPADSGLAGTPAINGVQRDTAPAPQVHSPMEAQPARGFQSPAQSTVAQPLPTWESPDAVREQFQKWRNGGASQPEAAVESAHKQDAPPAARGFRTEGDAYMPGYDQTRPLGGSGSELANAQDNEIAPGVYRHARGQYSDNPAGMGFSPGFTGRPSANNIAAADALAARSAADVSAMAARGLPPPPGPQMAVIGGGYGLRDPNYLAERNALVSASSMTNARDRNPKTGMSPADAALADVYDGRKQASDRAIQEIRAGTDVQRTAMQEQGALQRQAMGDATKMAEVHARGVSDQAGRNLDERKFTLESQVKGVEMRGALRQQQLQDVAMNPHATPEQRAAALHALQIMRGGAQRAGQGAQLPTAALKMQQEELDALGISSSIDADLGAINQQLDSGQLTLGPLRNLWNRGRNAIGASTDESRNLATFDATLEKLRNDSLRLNKGVQTEGDAQRAWNEVLKNTSDPELVRQRLAEVQRINQRAAELRAANVDRVRQNFGADPMDTSPYRNVAPAVGQQSQATAAQSEDWGRQWQAIPSGTLYTAPDGSIRRKK